MKSTTQKPVRETREEQPDEVPHGDQPSHEPDEPSELDEIDPDDDRWDVFIADDDERDPQPDYGDFWPVD